MVEDIEKVLIDGNVTDTDQNLLQIKIFSEHIFLQDPPNMFHINRSSSEPIHTTDFVLVSFGQYWIILRTRFSSIFHSNR